MDRTSHRDTGLYKLLERPRVHEGLRRLVGGPASRARFVSEFVRPFKGVRVLDIGCGTGPLLSYLPPTASYVGYDLNPAYIEAARRRYGPRGQFFCARVGDEPRAVEDGGFDIVVAASMLHHLDDDDAGRLVREARRALAPGGSFVSIDPALHRGQAFVSRLFARLDRGREVRSPDAYRRVVEPHFSRIEDWLLTDLLRIPYSHCVIRAT